MFQNVVKYLIYTGQLPPFSAQGYEYILAGNGVFVRAENNVLSACIPVQQTVVRGLPSLEMSVTVRGIHSLPRDFLTAALADAKRFSHRETLYYVVKKEAQFRLEKPPQAATATSGASG